MTESQLRAKIAKWPVQYLGIDMGSAEHLEILKVFNDSKLCTRYKMTKKDHWCATTVSAAFIANGMAGKAGSGKLFECVECSCGNMITAAKKQGIWVEADNHTPKVGDAVMYDWDDTGKGNNTGWPDHVGIVVSVSNSTKTFKVIEGNMNGTVGYRTMAFNGKFIRGFITPKYSKFATKTTTTTTTKPKKETTTTSSKTKDTSSLNKTCKFKGKTTTATNVHSWAGVSYDKLRKLAKGKTVEVCDTIKDKSGNDWYYIKESGKYGFVNADYIAKNSTTTTKNTSLNKTRKFKGTTTTRVNVRSWAGTEYDKLRTLAKGKTVEVCDSIKASSGKTWYYIKESSKYGFVSAEYIARK